MTSVISAAQKVLTQTIYEQFSTDAVGKVYLEHAMTDREVASADIARRSEIATHRSVATDISKHVIPVGQDRITIPLLNTDHPTKQAVEGHLLRNGFHGVDYGAGHVKDSYDRTIKIGKALTQSQAPKELVDRYATHQPTYKPSGNENLEVVISRHPHDVIGMSQGTGWGLRPNETQLPGEDHHTQSCMRMGTSEHSRHIGHELNAGTHIAWLVTKGDHEAKNPISRVTLRPYTSDDKVGGLHAGAIAVFHHNSRGYRQMVDYSRDMGHTGSDNDAFADAISHRVDMMLGSKDDAVDSGESKDVIDALSHADGVQVSDVTHENGMSKVHIKYNTPVSRQHSFDLAGMSTPFIDSTHIALTPAPSPPAHTILRRGKVYGKNIDAFTNTVDNFTETHFPKQVDTYNSAPSIYLDGSPSHV